MYQYFDCSMNKEKNHVIFSAKALAVLDNDEKLGVLSIPEWWETAVCQKLCSTSCKAYYCCTHALAHGFYNKVTDYVGIWKLASLPKGDKESSYDLGNGRVYWGIIEEDAPSHLKHYANVVVLLPQDQTFPDAVVAGLWKKYNIGFLSYPSKEFFEELISVLPRAYIIHYAENGESVLELWGNNVDQMFDMKDAMDKSCMI